MDNAPSHHFSSAAVVVIVAAAFIVLGVAVPALTYRRRQSPEKFPQFVRRVFSRRRK